MLESVHLGSNPWIRGKLGNKLINIPKRNYLFTIILVIHLDKCYLYPMISLNIQHFYPVSCNRKSTIILGLLIYEASCISYAYEIWKIVKTILQIGCLSLKIGSFCATLGTAHVRLISSVTLFSSCGPVLNDNWIMGFPGARGTPKIIIYLISYF